MMRSYDYFLGLPGFASFASESLRLTLVPVVELY
jgi:hypothetical protein